MYLCSVDESGTHGSSPVLVGGGIVIHEEDSWHLQQRLDSFLRRKLNALGHAHTEFELHGSEIWSRGKNWDRISQPDRRRILNGAFGTRSVGVRFGARAPNTAH